MKLREPLITLVASASLLALSPRTTLAGEPKVNFDPHSKVARILAITEINEHLNECMQESHYGSITKVSGHYPTLEVWVRGRREEVAFDLDLQEFDMVTIKALNTLVAPGKRVRVQLQRCGSGAIPYVKSIQHAGQN